MNSSECRTYAQQCALLAEKLPAEHRDVLLGLAGKWLQAAAELAAQADAKSSQAK
jgi:hypothetical protein